MMGTPERNRRLLFVVVAGTLAVTVALLSMAFVGGVYLVRGTRTVNSDRLPPDLPAEVVLCPHFQVSRSSVSAADSGARRYEVDGECPVNPVAMQDAYVHDLEYHGWTVHTDDSGGILAYAYDRHEQLTATLQQSSANDNQTTLQVEVLTEVTDPPPGFPPPPSPR
jgi:hypothetical protein